MSRKRIWIDPAYAGDRALRAQIERDNPGAEILPRRPFKTELTPIGEQYVIPGCEKDTTRGTGQLGLWD